MNDLFIPRGNIMEWEITIHKDYEYIEIVTKGVADNHGSIEMAKSIAETMRHHRMTKALIDHRNVTNVSGNAVEVYERPKLFKIIGVILGIKIAEVIKPDHLEHFKFLETVCVNRGYKFSVFFDRTKALEWLLS
jgi:hypothetical protein